MKRTLKSKTLIDNHFLSLKEESYLKENGESVDSYFVLERPDVAVISGITKNNEILLIKQYRQAVKSLDIEIPAGYLEKHDSNPEKAAKRELLEETGFTSNKFEKIHETYASAGLMNNKIHFFIAHDVKRIKEPNLDKNEEIEVLVTPWEEAIKLHNEGIIKDMASVTALLLTKNYLKL